MLREDLVVAQGGAAFALLERYTAPRALLVVISGPSGVGKDSVIQRMRELGSPFHFLVTATDRSPRPGEVHGVDYLFYSTAEFERMIAHDELLEYANVYGQYKGVPREQVRRALAAGADVLMRVDIQGAATLRRIVPEAVTVFLAPPSIEALLSRLRRRGSDSPEQVHLRLEMALAEMQRAPEFDYVVVNREGDLDGAVQAISAIIQADRCRTDRGQVIL
jgi:guanylate kinase